MQFLEFAPDVLVVRSTKVQEQYIQAFSVN